MEKIKIPAEVVDKIIGAINTVFPRAQDINLENNKEEWKEVTDKFYDDVENEMLKSGVPEEVVKDFMGDARNEHRNSSNYDVYDFPKTEQLKLAGALLVYHERGEVDLTDDQVQALNEVNGFAYPKKDNTNQIPVIQFDYRMTINSPSNYPKGGLFDENSNGEIAGVESTIDSKDKYMDTIIKSLKEQGNYDALAVISKYQKSAESGVSKEEDNDLKALDLLLEGVKNVKIESDGDLNFSAGNKNYHINIKEISESDIGRN